MIIIKIVRFDPGANAPPYLQDYRVADGFRESTILDVLDYLQREDPTLRFRRPDCRNPIQADWINVNGENRLTHATRVESVLGTGNTLVLRPLTGLRVMHDLVVEMLPLDASLHSLFQGRPTHAPVNTSSPCRNRPVRIA